MEKRVPYLHKDFERSTEKELMLKWYSIMVKATYTKRYHIGFRAIVMLKPVERHLLDFISEVMDKRNLVSNTRALKDEFNGALKGIKKKSTRTIPSTAPSTRFPGPALSWPRAKKGCTGSTRIFSTREGRKTASS